MAERLGWDGASRESGGGGPRVAARGSERRTACVFRTRFAFPPGFRKLAPPGGGC